MESRDHSRRPVGLPLAALGALGIVYGDIGTSPLYALRACFEGETAPAVTEEANVLGVLSLFFWALMLVVCVKYLAFVLRAANHGEGGVLSLLSLVIQKTAARPARWIALLGVTGAALLSSEGMLTPAISVVSAVEGLEHVAHGLSGWVVPLSITIIVGLFLVQRRGTAGIGALFGPIMLVWFATLAALSLPWILRRPDVLLAINPAYAIGFVLDNPTRAMSALAGVVLCVTGSEALYADLGHFGHRPIRWAWFTVAFPGLVLSYFGQGAVLLDSPAAVANPFFAVVPHALLIPVTILATMATVIASQALISGVFSLTSQGIQLGYLPRLRIVHTSRVREGQIYLPEVNWALMVCCVGLVILFPGSSELSAAYGTAVTLTMTITTLLFTIIASRWWGLPAGLAIGILFLSLDIPFVLANADKIPHGAWVPLAIGGVLFVMMTTWRAGRVRLAQFLQSRAGTGTLEEFAKEIVQSEVVRVPGTAVFLTSAPTGVPPLLRHHLEHNRALHEQIIVLSILTEHAPFVSNKRRVDVEPLKDGFFRVVAHYGFMQTPRVKDILTHCHERELHAKVSETSFYLGRERLVVTKRKGMLRWRKMLFVILSKNAHSAADFFDIPAERVVEVGMQIEL